MKVDIVEETKNEIKIRLMEEGYTLCNLLQALLSEDESVEFAGYNIPHPLVNYSEIYVRVKEGNPRTPLIKAAKKIVEEAERYAVLWKKLITQTHSRS